MIFEAFARLRADQITKKPLGTWVVTTAPIITDAMPSAATRLPMPRMSRRPDVVRLFRPEPETLLYVLFHADHRRTARIRAVVDWLTEAVIADRPLLAGARPRAAP